MKSAKKKLPRPASLKSTSNMLDVFGPGLERPTPYSPPPDQGLDIVYQDDALVAINKPSGLLSVPGRRPEMADCAINRVKSRFPEVLLVHRLDEATSGLLVFARTKAAQKSLSWFFESRLARKQYIAWVQGFVTQTQGEIDAPMRLDGERRPINVVDPIDGKPARTIYSLIEHDPLHNRSKVLLEPFTGRTHQLRVHMLHIGHPIMGDDLYGSGNAAPRLMLHASQLTLPHPQHPGEGEQGHLKLVCPAPF